MIRSIRIGTTLTLNNKNSTSTYNLNNTLDIEQNKSVTVSGRMIAKGLVAACNR